MKTKFEEGYMYFTEGAVANYANMANQDFLNEQFLYIQNQQDKIAETVETLMELVNEKRNLGDAQRQGFLFEAVHREGYNYDLVKNNQTLKPAYTPQQNGYASPDIIADETKYNAKVYADAHKTFKAIARTHRQEFRALKRSVSVEKFKAERGIKGNLDDLKYHGQKNLVTADQKDDIIKDAGSGARASINKGARAEKNYREIQRNTTDCIEDRYGNKSNPITKAELEELDKLALNKELDSETIKAFGFDPSKSICLADIKAQLIKQSLNTGVTAATIAAVINLAPIIISALYMLNENGELDVSSFCELGYQALSVPAKSFIIGCTSAAIINGINFSHLKTLVNGVQANPLGVSCSFIAMGVAIVVNSIEIAIKQAMGVNSKFETAEQITDLCLTSLLSVAGGILSKQILSKIISVTAQQSIDKIITAIVTKAFGITTTAVFPAFSVISYMIGSLVGFAVSKLILHTSKKLVLSFCVESGCTFFGLVDQNYKLPQEIIEQIGIEVFDYEKFEYDNFRPDSFQVDTFSFDSFEYDKFGITILRRGVIGVGKVGYV